MSILQVPLYSNNLVRQYASASTTSDLDNLRPHIFLTTSRAYKAMCSSGVPQSLVISGESGSGKTVTTKIVMEVRRPSVTCIASQRGWRLDVCNSGSSIQNGSFGLIWIMDYAHALHASNA